jgi:hypothetical protein
MGIPVTTRFDNTTNRDLLKEGSLRQIFDTTLDKAQSFFAPLVNSKKTDLWIERDLRMAGLTTAQRVYEGQQIPLQSPTMGTTKEYTQMSFGTGFRMTRVMEKANKHGLWKKWAGQLADVQKTAKDIEIHTMFNNMTSTSLECGTGFDTLAIASTAHTGLLGGSTADNFSNYLDAGLSQSALQSARYYFKTLKDDYGVLASATPTNLVFEPTLWPTVRELLGSDLKPHEMSNTINVLPEMKLTAYEDPRLTATTCWFVIAKDSKYDFNVFTMTEPIFITKDAPDQTLDRIALTVQDFTYGWGDARRLYAGNT